MSIEEPNDVPEVWRPYFRSRRIEFTFRDLDRNVEGVALNTIRRALLGIGTPSRRVVAALASELGMTEEEFHATRAKVNGATPTTPFTLPTSADLLTQRERDAVLSVVHALLDARDRHADQPESTPTASPTPQPGAPSEAAESEKTGAGDPRDPDDYDLAGRDTGGISESEQTRRDMDQQGEAPDPDGPEDGA